MIGKRVLIADDRDENLYLLRALLQGHGCQVEQASNGARALELAQQDPPDLIITDILMPVMDGFALCRAWKQDPRLKAIPFIFYTATYTDERDRQFALSLGAERFIIKPEEPDVFIEIIRDTLQKVDAPQTDSAVIEADLPAVASTDADYLTQYNATLIRKLESKMQQLERDIAARQRVESALRESEARFRALVEAAPEGIFVQSGGRFIFANPAMLFLLGATSIDEVLEAQLMDRIAPEYRTAVQERIRFQRETGSPVPLMEQEYLRMDGSRVPVETTAVAIEYDGQSAHLVFVRDITERRAAEAERQRLQAQLAQAQKMESVGRLAGGVAHDYNNMLTVMLGHLELALAQVDEESLLYADLQEILRAAQRSADLTQQLLAFARKQTVSPRVLDLNDAVAGLLRMLQRLIGEDIELRWIPGAALWSVRMDLSQISQILVNLCVNARDAIEGIGRITIETENITLDEAYCAQLVDSTPGDYVLLTVGDDGSGMDAETQGHLFEPFFTTKPVGQGTGLGLATVYGIVKQNEGLINVYSERGQGTVFRIYLPRHKAKATEGAPWEGAEQATARGQETILLVEDEVAILRLARTLLERAGYTVLATDTPGAAVHLAEEHAGAIDLLITDVVMPEMNGRDVARRLLSLYPHLKRLFTSGYTADVIAHHGVVEEGVEFLQKPFSPQALLAKVRQVLDKE